MEFGTREILIVLGIIIILGILLDGLRRVKLARHGSLRVSRRKQAIFDDENFDDISSDFPSGQVRVKHRDERSAEEISDNIKRYRDSASRNCTSAYRDIAETKRREETPPSEPVDELIDDTIPESSPEQSGASSLDQFEVESDGDGFAGISDDDKPVAGQPWVATRDEPDISLDKPFRLDASEADAPRQEELSSRPVSRSEPKSVPRESRGKPFWQEREKEPEPRQEPRPRQEPQFGPANADDDTGSEAREFDVVIVHVMAGSDRKFDGAALLDALLSQGMRYGDMGIFHRHEKENGSGPVKFSLANSVKPGTFDIEHMEDFSTPGVTMFMPLENLRNPLDVFDIFVKTAQSLAKTLNGELKDETRSAFTKQTVEHCRQQIIEYTRKSFTLSHN